MKVLVCNVGSTSLKYKLLDSESNYAVLFRGGAERIGSDKASFYFFENGKRKDHPLNPTRYRDAIQEMLCQLNHTPIDCVAFKVVHAKGITGVQELNDRILDAMGSFIDVAPAHNPPYMDAIRLFKEIMPSTPLIGSFETGFHAGIPDKAALYSIPYEISKEYEIRRYGFHGASHEYLTEYAENKLKNINCKLITCHLGGSGSICAVDHGKSIDTSFGLSLQCGIMQNNRVGDLDPYVIFHLMEKGYSKEKLKDIFEKKSGLLGVSGISNDVRDLQEAAENGNERAKLALEMYAYGIRKYIGSYLAVLNGCDAIVFGGGIGEKSSLIRKLTLENMDNLSVEIDLDKNERARPGDDISKKGSKTRIYIAETDEELIVAKKVVSYLSSL